LAGVAVVAISVGVGVGVARGKKGPGDPPINVGSVPTVADTGTETLADTGTEPFASKESFLRADGRDHDIVDEIPEVDEVDKADEIDKVDDEDEVDKTLRVGVDYSRNWGGYWGGRPKCGSSKSGKGSKGSRRQCKFLPLHLTLIVL